MAAESTTEGTELQSEASRCRPPFPIFPFVFPMIFLIGIMVLIGRRRNRRERALQARGEEVD
jgi:hypothetical protein